jgi:putative LysE/RhtB family amino acid efflux pump
MTFELLWKAVLLGLVNSAPIGPVGLWCLKKNLMADRGTGLSAGLGMAVAYAIIAFFVLFGLKVISRFLQDHETLFQLGGGALLIVMGWRGLAGRAGGLATRYLREFSASFAMTLFNPVPFASFAVMLTTFRILGAAPDLATDLLFALGVFAGAMVFWLVVNEGLHHVKRRSPEVVTGRINRATSMVLLAMGVWIAARGVLLETVF